MIIQLCIVCQLRVLRKQLPRKLKLNERSDTVKMRTQKNLLSSPKSVKPASLKHSFFKKRKKSGVI